MNNVVLTMYKHLLDYMFLILWYLCVGVAGSGSYDKCIYFVCFWELNRRPQACSCFNFLRKWQTIFPGDYSILQSYQHHMVLVVQPYLLFSHIAVFLAGKVISSVVLICTFITDECLLVICISSLEKHQFLFPF